MSEINYVLIGKRIRETRTQMKLSQAALAEMSGLPQSTISSWYRKQLVPTVPSLSKICSAFGITLSQLLAENGEAYDLSQEQQRLLSCWSHLSSEQQDALLSFLEKI